MIIKTENSQRAAELSHVEDFTTLTDSEIRDVIDFKENVAYQLGFAFGQLQERTEEAQRKRDALNNSMQAHLNMVYSKLESVKSEVYGNE